MFECAIIFRLTNMDSLGQHARSCCPACAGERSIQIAQFSDSSVLRCKTCSTVYRSIVRRFNYDESYTASAPAIPAYVTARQNELIASFGQYRVTNRYLDVGFGRGGTLRAAFSANWDVYGAELSRSAIEMATREGFNVTYGELSQVNYPDDYFDVIVMSELIEHLEDPIPLLREASRILRHGGLLYLTTPHGDGVTRRLLCERWTVLARYEHIQLFSKEGVERMITANGFRDISVETKNVDPYDYLFLFKPRRDPYSYVRTPMTQMIGEQVNSSPWRVGIKNAINLLLQATSLGDSLQIRAIK